MQNQSMARVTIDGSVSAAQCSVLRDSVEGRGFELSGMPVHVVPVPGAEFWQLPSSIATVTYMLLDGAAYFYDSQSFRWRRMRISVEDFKSMRHMVKRIA